MILFACFILPGIWVLKWASERAVPAIPWEAVVGALAIGAFVVIVVMAPAAVSAVGKARSLFAALALATVVVVGFGTPDPQVIRFGSDRNEALTLATSRLLSGRYPYSEPTSLGVPVTPMPGALVISAPMVAATGNAGFQNALALLLLAGAVLYVSASAGGAALAWAVVLASPYVLYQIVVGGDLLQNAAFVAVAALWMLASSDWQRWLAALAFGVTLAWRPNFVFIVPAVLTGILVERGVREAFIAGALAGLGSVAVTLPFLLPDPGRFSPLHVTSRTEYGFVPFSGLTIPAAFLAISLLGAWLVHRFRRRGGAESALLACGAVMAFQALTIFALNSVQRGQASLGTLGYLVFAVPFLVLGVTSALESDRPPEGVRR